MTLHSTNYNPDYPFEGIFKYHEKFYPTHDFEKDPLNNDDLKLLVDSDIYFLTHKSRKLEDAINSRLPVQIGFKGFSESFYHDGSQYSLTRKVTEDVDRKLRQFYMEFNPSQQFLQTYKEMVAELSIKKNPNEKLDYLLDYKKNFVEAYGCEDTAYGIFLNFDPIETGFLQAHLTTKIWNYDNPILIEWGMVTEIEEFIHSVDTLIFENRMLSQGKIILDTSLSGRQKVVLLDKLARMDVQNWEANSIKKQAKIFEFLIANTESYIMDVLKEINNSKNDNILRTYEEMDTLYRSIS